VSAEGKPRILVADDEELLALGISENLAAEGYAPVIAADGAAALAAARGADLDLILLDVMMPKLDGYAVCAALRAEGNEVPILFLTARGALEDRVRGLEAGGDDYLAKPFALKELLLRVAAILRRKHWYGAAAADKATLRFAGHEVDFAAYRARTADGAEHRLTHKEAMILRCLAERARAVVSREDILDLVWGYEVYPSTRTIDNFIVRLRKLFEPEPDAPRHIHTVRGVGYRFTAEPERRELPRDPPVENWP
jgi:two-component system alkaline phosphatase synthesis response regulator PhoP